jgi:hypothetical protein
VGDHQLNEIKQTTQSIISGVGNEAAIQAPVAGRSGGGEVGSY